ncbi:MAG: YHS domain-containing protein [Myxococcales bacterium]|nr:YHS domain-containing protein [Myxococcales bacterium]
MSDRAIAFADLAGFTALTEAHGDEDAADLAGAFYAMAKRCLVGETRLVKPIGDAVLLAGASADDTLTSVLGLAFSVEHQADFPGLRTGAHFGSVVEREGDVFGSTVNVAARVAAHARSGQILCTRALREALGKDCAQFLPIGPVRLKNVIEPIELFELVACRSPSTDRDLDPVCRMRLPPGSAWWLEHQGRIVRFCSARCRETFAAAPERFESELAEQ